VSETVFILGAGASKGAGAPVMKDFLDEAERIHRSSHRSDADFTLVFQALAALQQAHSKSTIDLENVEEVFAAFEMAKLLGQLGTLSTEQIAQLPRAMRKVIEKTIEETILFPVSDGRIHPPAGYASLLRTLREATVGSSRNRPHDFLLRRPNSFSIISFNYDLALDYGLYSSGIHASYCLGEETHPEGMALLKLHGSLNWVRCLGCQKIIGIPLDKYFQNRHFFLEDAKSIRIPFSTVFPQYEHCPGSTVEGPFVVPPTWNKTQYHEALESVWKAASVQLCDAQNIFICGYSLPQTDQFFRYLYALGTIGTTRIQKFWVFNPDPGVKNRFEKMLGQGAIARFQFFERSFETSFPHIRPVFGLPTN
jgi:hypothetical protein